ncbi:MAG TPA: hypothetical protein GXX14_14050 [Clostridiaceae bacterium]|nr:hypothetical protein [Clostridiaceae bacterium]
MKLLVFRVNVHRKNAYDRKKINIEKLLFFLFIMSFSAMLLVQAMLLDPTLRAALVVEEEFEGTPLGKEEFLYNEGFVVLRLEGGIPGGNIKVLLNGEVFGSFEGDKLVVPVIDGDVIEIDGSDILGEFDVVIESLSENVSGEFLGKRVTVSSDVKKLARVRVK